jgi:hypothetical protein
LPQKHCGRRQQDPRRSCCFLLRSVQTTVVRPMIAAFSRDAANPVKALTLFR